MKKILALIITSILFVTNVNAASKCSYEEQTKLNGKAGNVKVSYEITEVESDTKYKNLETGEIYSGIKTDAFKINILNISEDVYVVITNDVNKDSLTLRYSDTENGVGYFIWKEKDKVTNFVINVYSSLKTGCPNEVYKTLYLVTPRFNNLSGYEACKGLDDFYLCQKYVTFGEVSRDSFNTKINQYKNKEIDNKGEVIPTNKTIFDKVFNFVKDNKWFIVSGIVIVAGAVFAINYTKNKKQRDLGL